MAVLITGAAGFIGGHLTEHLLAEGEAPLLGLDHFTDDYDPAVKRGTAARLARAGVEIIEADFTDFEEMARLFARRQVSAVVHLGGRAGVRASVARPEDYVRANVLGTLSLLEAARREPVERFVLVSSSTVYGRGAAAPFQEDAPLGRPASPYGTSKRAAELLGINYHELHGVPVVGARPFSVYGPRLRPDLSLMVFTRAILAGEPIPLFGDGSARRDFTHVRDVCRGLAAALRAPGVEGEFFNLGHEEPVELRRLLAELEALLGRSAVIEHLPPRPEELATSIADLRKSRERLGYQPRVGLAAGLAEFVQWYLHVAAGE